MKPVVMDGSKVQVIKSTDGGVLRYVNYNNELYGRLSDINNMISPHSTINNEKYKDRIFVEELILCKDRDMIKKILYVSMREVLHNIEYWITTKSNNLKCTRNYNRQKLYDFIYTSLYKEEPKYHNNFKEIIITRKKKAVEKDIVTYNMLALNTPIGAIREISCEGKKYYLIKDIAMLMVNPCMKLYEQYRVFPLTRIYGINTPPDKVFSIKMSDYEGYNQNIVLELLWKMSNSATQHPERQTIAKKSKKLYEWFKEYIKEPDKVNLNLNPASTHHITGEIEKTKEKTDTDINTNINTNININTVISDNIKQNKESDMNRKNKIEIKHIRAVAEFYKVYIDNFEEIDKDKAIISAIEIVENNYDIELKKYFNCVIR